MIIFCKMNPLIILILLNIIWLNMETNFDLLSQFDDNHTTNMTPHHQTYASQIGIVGCGMTTQDTATGNPSFGMENIIN